MDFDTFSCAISFAIFEKIKIETKYTIIVLTNFMLSFCPEFSAFAPKNILSICGYSLSIFISSFVIPDSSANISFLASFTASTIFEYISLSIPSFEVIFADIYPVSLLLISTKAKFFGIFSFV